jgi:hypothetical protein
MGGGLVLQKKKFITFRAIGKQVYLWENALDDDDPSTTIMQIDDNTENGALVIQLPGTLHS